MAFINLEMYDENDLHEDIVSSDSIELPDDDVSDIVNVAMQLVLVRREKKQSIEHLLNDLETLLTDINLLKKFN